MAKNKEYNGAIVENEFNKLSTPEQLETYNNLGIWIHNKIVANQKVLGDELNSLEEMKKQLNCS